MRCSVPNLHGVFVFIQATQDDSLDDRAYLVQKPWLHSRRSTASEVWCSLSFHAPPRSRKGLVSVLAPQLVLKSEPAASFGPRSAAAAVLLEITTGSYKPKSLTRCAMGVSTSPSARGTRLMAQCRSLDAWQILEYANAQYPERLAIVDGPPAVACATATYSQFYQHCLHLVAYLRSLGVQRGQRVAVMLRNCSEVMALHYAAAALRAIIVNINVNLAPQELAYILADSGAEFIVASPEFAAVLQQAAAIGGQVPAGEPELQLAAAAPAGEGVQPLSISAVIWTLSIQQQQQQHESAAAQLPTVPNWSSRMYPYGAAASQQHTTHSHLVSSAAASISTNRSSDEGGINVPDENDGLHMYYTSGTTGRPKGVVLSHKIVVLHAIGTIMGEGNCRNSLFCKAAQPDKH
eukprot:GHUV01023373.1.p1 GENE.GHUV01023373.1~~GHUV01023373.1.p1  ORF type:complete len:406 (-),score=110.57 GHUV01023373.1:667-1884(-)